MKLITRHTDYAVIALCHLARSRDPVSATDLCREFGMPRAFIRGILQKLNAEGYLRSARGKGGGFTLRRPAREITVCEVMETFQGSLTADGCLFRKKPCPRRSGCALRKRLQAVERSVAAQLSAASIAALAEGAC